MSCICHDILRHRMDNAEIPLLVQYLLTIHQCMLVTDTVGTLLVNLWLISNNQLLMTYRTNGKSQYLYT